MHDDTDKLTPLDDEIVVSIKEAVAMLDAQDAEFRAKQEATRKRDAAYWRSVYGLDRIEALESVLRELVGADDLPPGWVSVSATTEPLDICGYCGALAEYHQEERHWHASHTDDCPITRALTLLDAQP